MAELLKRLKDVIMPVKESTIDKQFRKKVANLPFPVVIKKIHGYGIGNQNEPDWFVITNGRFGVIETKRDDKLGNTNKDRREGQRIVRELYQRAGAKVAKCYDSDDMVAFVVELYNEQKRLIDLAGEVY